MWLTANTNLYIQPKMEQKCQAHNLKVVGSNPNPETNLFNKINDLHVPQELRFFGFFAFYDQKLVKSDKLIYLKKKR